jgi:hypothetical protein
MLNNNIGFAFSNGSTKANFLEVKMPNGFNTRLTAAEIANLWSQYQNDTLAVCVNSYMYKSDIMVLFWLQA